MALQRTAVPAPPPPSGPAPVPGRPHSRGTILSDNDRTQLASLASRFGVPAFDMAQANFPTSILELVPVEIARKHVILPLHVRDDTLYLAMANPSEKRVLEELEFVSGRKVFPYVADPQALTSAIERAYDARNRGEARYAGPRAAQNPGMGLGEPSADGHLSGAVTDHQGEAPEALAEEDPFAESEMDLGGPAPTSAGGLSAFGSAGPTLDSVMTPLAAVRGRTILVVDDEDDIRKLLRRMLESKGFTVVEASRGLEALEKLKLGIPDAIILDAMLPELHGFELCRRLRSSARFQRVPILMISAVYRGWRYAEDLKSVYGIHSFIEKPFRIAEVLEAVEQMLAGIDAEERDPEAMTQEATSLLNASMDSYRRGALEQAIGQLEQALQLDPLSYRLHYHIALLLGRKGELFQAIQALDTAVSLNPRSFSALKNLAVLYQQAGFKHKAIELWERAISHSPDLATRAQLKEHLLSML